MGKRECVALLGLSSWCLVIVVWLFFAVPLVCLRFVIVVFPDHTHLHKLENMLLFASRVPYTLSDLQVGYLKTQCLEGLDLFLRISSSKT